MMDGFGNTPIRRSAARRTPAPPAAARIKRTASNRVHPAIYWIIVALAGWLVLSVWGFLGSGYAGLALAVVTIFIVIAVTVPLTLWGIARRYGRHRAAAQDDSDESLSEWLAHEFDVDAGRMKTTVAAMEILLPIAAVAFGMTIFALVRYFDGVV
jgi:hypothetical protein